MKKRIDWMITLIPLVIIGGFSILFFVFPDQSNQILSQIRFFFGDTMGSFYVIVGLGIFLISCYICMSKYGNIVLGNPNEKPKYSFFAWGSMMFTCGLAADFYFILFQNGLCMQVIIESLKWELFKSGEEYFQCFIGVLFLGDFILYLQ